MATAFAVRVGMAVCTDGCAGGTCGKTHIQTFAPAAILAATAPAVANPYLNTNMSTAAAAATGTGGGGAEQQVCGHFVPRHCTDAEKRAENPWLQRLMDADHWLCSLYGDPQSAGWTEDSGVVEEEEDGDPQENVTLRRVRAEGLLGPNVDPGTAEDDCRSRYEPGTGFSSALFDARNGFNELNRYCHLWNQGSRFAFNHYWHWVCCLVRPGLSQGTHPLSSTRRRGSRKATASP
jgi:hypothetical protein